MAGTLYRQFGFGYAAENPEKLVERVMPDAVHKENTRA